jgi:hypothetical protein
VLSFWVLQVVMSLRHSSLTRDIDIGAAQAVGAVQTLLETLDVAQSKRGVSAKKALRDYARFYFEQLPALDSSTIKMLLTGSSGLKVRSPFFLFGRLTML